MIAPILDERNFAKLTPHLNALKNRIDFSEIHQVVDTGFTIKGLFGSHCAANYTFASAKDMASENFTKILSALAKFYTLWDTIPIL